MRELYKQKLNSVRKLFQFVIINLDRNLVWLEGNSPSLMASTMLQSITVGILWATVMTVHSANSVLIDFWMIASVALSIDAVASSSTNMRLLLNSARPKQNNCRCPMLQFDPSSTTIVCMVVKRAN